MTDRVKIMTEKLVSLRSCEAEKEALERDIAECEAEIVRVKKRKQEIFSEKEREKIIRNHESKIEMAAKLEEAKNSLEKMKKKEIEINAKLSILQNYQLALELESFSERINLMLKENARFQQSIEKQNRDMEIQKSSQVEFLEREKVKKRQIVKLTERHEKLLEEINDLESDCVKRGLIEREPEQIKGSTNEVSETDQESVNELRTSEGIRKTVQKTDPPCPPKKQHDEPWVIKPIAEANFKELQMVR